MVTLITPTVFVTPTYSAVLTTKCPFLGVKLTKSRKNVVLRTAAVAEGSADPAQAVATWQIIVGSLAGVTPFVVAGIEFSKRIVAQRNCRVCKGSGLVLRDKKYYFRCPKCGGFLPWQSWKRFFSG